LPQQTDQIAALIRYVEQEFPGADVGGTMDGERSAHTVSVAVAGGILLLTASFEFLRDYDAASVTLLLQKWNTAAALRQAGITKRLLVTRSGPQIAIR
jgi:hypothetical protein